MMYLMRCEIEEMYDDYLWECEEQGIEPIATVEEWWENVE